jgi:S1-C subfamily serine protease
MRPGWFALLLLPLVLVGAGADDGRPGAHPERALVRITAQGCTAVDTVATGWRAQDGLVVTAAHAVRGSTSVQVGGLPARVVALDNRTDVAVLVPPATTNASPLALASVAGATHVWVARFPGTTGASAVSEAPAGPVVTATIDEPVDDTAYSRQAFPVGVATDRGDSGAPVVDGRGRVAGMLFATARDDSATAYAVAAGDIRSPLSQVDADSPSVDTGRCN